ncbi:S-methyl-5-thioribose-1-phosphate isomerase [Naganishia albida]|nr:S-methyl-5-thioribose-1-phosphate isomerase [Naganishia albida]
MTAIQPADPNAPTIPSKMMTSLSVQDDSIHVINQLLLPHQIQWDACESVEDAYDAIKSMRIRGAPAIASLAALIISLLLSRRLRSPTEPTIPVASATAHPLGPLTTPSALLDWLHPVLDYLQSSRPTAVNLSEAMNRIRATASAFAGDDAAQLAQSLIETCQAVHANDLERNKRMSQIGADWLFARRAKEGKKKLRVMTVCNTGSLATSGYGTALGVITNLFETGRLERAYYTQSTPYHQGSRLTSLELSTLGIPSCMICDTMVGSLFQHQDIDAVIVGADRVVKNGDTANKIGTYQAAALAKLHGIPFMVIAPVTTLDMQISHGKDIHIEQRPPVEATLARGLVVSPTGTSPAASSDGSTPAAAAQAIVQITPNAIGQGDNAIYNPSFDVTPAKLITCVVTEVGVAENKDGGDAIDLSEVQ